MAAGSKSSRSVPLNRTRSNPERIPVIFCPNLLRKLSGTPWVAGNSLVFTHHFYQGPRCSTMIWLRLCRAVILRGYSEFVIESLVKSGAEEASVPRNESSDLPPLACEEIVNLYLKDVDRSLIREN